MMDSGKELQVIIDAPGALSPIAHLADIPEEDIWLAKQKSKRTRRAYKLDVQHFMRTLSIRSYDKPRQVDHRAVIAGSASCAILKRRCPRRHAAGSRPLQPDEAPRPARPSG